MTKLHIPDRTSLLFTLALATIVALGCGGKDAPPHDGPGAAGRPGHGRPGGPNGKPQMPAMAVAVEEAQFGSISTYYSATASLDPDKQADILARVNGVIKEILVEEGDTVTEGQELLVIDDAEYQYRLTQAEVALEQQQLRLERIAKMRDQGLVSAEEHDVAASDLRAAQAAWELAALELSYTRVRASFAGRVVTRYVDVGQTVSNGTTLFSITDTHRLLARVHVPAREFRRIRTDQPVNLKVDSSGDRLEGRIDLISPVVDPSTGTIKVTVEITDYPLTTRQGDFAEVSIVTDRHNDALLVPRIAVLSERDQRVIYVADGNTTARRVVTIGFEDDKSSEVLEGLEAGELVIVQGQRSVTDGQEIKILDRVDFSDQPTAEHSEDSED